jgi:hypothetical protein
VTDVDRLLDQAEAELDQGIVAGEPATGALARTLRAQHAVLRAQIAALRQAADPGERLRALGAAMPGVVNLDVAAPSLKTAIRGAMAAEADRVRAAAREPMTVSVNSGPPMPCTVRLEQDWIDVSSGIATKPDPTWQMVDVAGHYHAWAKDGGLPTLKASDIAMPCDGSCNGACGGEGYTHIEYRCRICDQVIQPCSVPDEAARNRKIPGRSNHIIMVDGLTDQVPPEVSGQVSVKVADGQRTMFGPGYVTRLSATPQGALTHLVLRIDAGLVERLAA